jgi:UDP-3-O-[3-hydroxymyristoyl] glucosamine N-acyltransferase
MVTHTYSGGRDQTAVIGHAPEDRNWKPGDRAHKPFICSGARIEAFVTVDAGTKRATHIGRRTWLMKHVHVGHDAYIGEDCEIAPGAVICGHAEIGKGVKIGVNASILPYRKVGDGARIGAGAVVTKDVRRADSRRESSEAARHPGFAVGILSDGVVERFAALRSPLAVGSGLVRSTVVADASSMRGRR